MADAQLLAAVTERPLRFGRKDHIVSAWQRLLVRKGFVLEIDGEYGPKTLSATKVAQSWAGVTIDGLVGPVTWRAVEKKKRTRRPVTTVRNVLQPIVPFVRPKVVDCRDGRSGFPKHRTKTWAQRPIAGIKAKLGHYTGGPASFVADARFHVLADYLTKGGAPAIAYTLGVDKDGTLLVFNDPTDLTWHCDGGHNSDTLGIVFRGAAEGPTLAQRNTLRWLWGQLDAGTLRLVGGPWPKLLRSTTHRHVNSTSCPGTKGEAFYRAISKRFVTKL